MTTYIALLRGINVGGHKKVGMAELRAFAGELGLEDARTLLQSGNLVFRHAGQTTPAALEKRLETGAAKRLGLEADFMVRDAQEWTEVIAGNPFPEIVATDPSHLVVVFLKNAPESAAVEALRAAVRGPEVVQMEGWHAYLMYPVGIGNSKLTNVVVEKKLGTRGTGRNWNTILKLGALL